MESANKVFLTGTVVTEPVYSHSVYGEGFYEMFLSVNRLSAATDRLPITVSERLIAGWDVKVGSAVALNGQLRSYNKFDGGASRLRLTVFVREFEPVQEGRNPNLIELEGYICKPPIYRMTPFKREICDLLLAVNRAYNKSDYIPCIAWGRNARYVKDIPIGAKIQISGRVQSREYQKRLSETEIETRTAFEVSVNQIGTGVFVSGTGPETLPEHLREQPQSLSSYDGAQPFFPNDDKTNDGGGE
ncbi:single-stranded DNA-binding protein [Clostridia bacterium]|nr:single-stranded DNA-binding protein [Clostridia bacterium]